MLRFMAWHLAVLENDILVSNKNTASTFRVGKTVRLSSSTTVRWNLKKQIVMAQSYDGVYIIFGR